MSLAASFQEQADSVRVRRQREHSGNRSFMKEKADPLAYFRASWEWVWIRSTSAGTSVLVLRGRAGVQNTWLLKIAMAHAAGFALGDGMISMVGAEARDQGLNLISFHPFHMAVSYLDGPKTRSSVFYGLLDHFDFSIQAQLFVDDSGRTIIENVMLTILKSHSIAFSEVSGQTNAGRRFPGDEVDIC